MSNDDLFMLTTKHNELQAELEAGFADLSEKTQKLEALAREAMELAQAFRGEMQQAIVRARSAETELTTERERMAERMYELAHEVKEERAERIKIQTRVGQVEAVLWLIGEHHYRLREQGVMECVLCKALYTRNRYHHKPGCPLRNMDQLLEPDALYLNQPMGLSLTVRVEELENALVAVATRIYAAFSTDKVEARNGSTLCHLCGKPFNTELSGYDHAEDCPMLKVEAVLWLVPRKKLTKTKFLDDGTLGVDDANG